MKKKAFSLLSLGLGIFLLVQIVMPLASYKLWEWNINNQSTPLLNPSPANSILGVSIENTNSFPAFVSSQTRTSTPSYREFTLSIPSLKLENLTVKVDNNDFDQNLGQLPGSAMPGERGNLFVSGHSSLPQLFRPGNYKAIFAHLPDIKKGAEIIIEAGGQKFTYVVQGLKIVDPKEVGVINPPDQYGRYLTLMTCVPPGFYLKRLVVLASLGG